MSKFYILNKHHEVQLAKTRREAVEQGEYGYYVILQGDRILYDFWNQDFYKPENNIKEIIGHLEWMEETEEGAYQEWLQNNDPDKCGFTRQTFDDVIIRPATDRLRKVLMYRNGRAHLLERPYCLDSQGKVDLDITKLRRRHMMMANAVTVMDILKKEGHEAALAKLRQLENVEDNERLAKKLSLDISAISGIRHHGEFRVFCRKEYPYLYEAYMKHRFDKVEI